MQGIGQMERLGRERERERERERRREREREREVDSLRRRNAILLHERWREKKRN